ncbi:MAG TPA: Rv3654c family TadE-like protein [Acidimicrobiia bacterium]|nr:Rv3654c family TadE-like protein [Acidimicrobiia bacterium]
MSRGERGAASLLLLGVIAIALLLGAALGSVGAYFRTRVEAATAADAAALAAAPVTFLPFGASGSPTDEARRMAAANGATLLSCVCQVDASWDPRTVHVEVEKVAHLWPAGRIAVRAVGKAEFTPARLLSSE